MIVSRSAATLIESIHTTLREQQFLPRLSDLSRRRNKTARFESMLSRSAAMWDLFDLCTRIAPADATVLIAGETGTGKELLARAVHRRSQREGRFVAANLEGVGNGLCRNESGRMRRSAAPFAKPLRLPIDWGPLAPGMSPP